MTTTERMAIAERVATTITALESGRGTSGGVVVARAWIGRDAGVVRVYVDRERTRRGQVERLAQGYLEVDDDGDLIDHLTAAQAAPIYTAIESVGTLYAAR